MFINDYLPDAISKEEANQNRFSLALPTRKKGKTPLQIGVEAVNIISCAPQDLAIKMVGTGLFSRLAELLTMKDDSVSLTTVDSILKFISNESDDIFGEFVEECKAHLAVCNLVTKTKNAEVKTRCVNLLTKFMERDLGEEDTINIIKLMNAQARENHGIYNYYLIVAYHHISCYAIGFFEAKELYDRVLLFMSQPDPIICHYCAEALPKLLKENRFWHACQSCSKRESNLKYYRNSFKRTP